MEKHNFMPKITVKNLNLEFEFSSTNSILNSLAMKGISVFNLCGGKGMCGMCRIKVLSTQDNKIKSISEPEKKHLSEKEIQAGYRLACQTFSVKDIEIEVYGAKIKDKG